jgi:hypothetical protein
VKVAGVDLSLVSTGVALVDRGELVDTRTEVHLVQPKRLNGLQLLQERGEA